MSLIACPSCTNHVLSHETSCPHCGTRLRNDRGVVARTATAVLMGLSLTACPADDDGNETMGGSSPTTTGSPDPGSTSGSTGLGTTSDPATGSLESDYGVPSSAGSSGFGDESSTGGSSSGSGSGSGSDSGSTSIGEPEYGVPETTGE